VVIGILIAFSISNWNEKYKKEKLKDSFIIACLELCRIETLGLLPLIVFIRDVVTIKEMNKQTKKIDYIVSLMYH